ncbi:uncharacterized protein CTRU02_215531 [Colletotrichum truncatum]|uniref:Uncharacterized protein n=1 Tax=Colletotrichum truncatum TaxID=5467 RepID=A0ACC3YCR2_COLTU|nr:uncharacterized protein CTRU02_05525 [Colletotrichum truncatum]KAF6793968.1 hypothetical protein CTRU02_05525 [Colletotrichum truncatum]
MAGRLVFLARMALTLTGNMKNIVSQAPDPPWDVEDFLENVDLLMGTLQPIPITPAGSEQSNISKLKKSLALSCYLCDGFCEYYSRLVEEKLEGRFDLFQDWKDVRYMSWSIEEFTMVVRGLTTEIKSFHKGSMQITKEEKTLIESMHGMVKKLPSQTPSTSTSEIANTTSQPSSRALTSGSGQQSVLSAEPYGDPPPPYRAGSAGSRRPPKWS